VSTFLSTLLLFALIVAAMAVGVAFTGRRLRGSCGGMGAGDDCSCSKARQAKCKAEGRPTPHAEQPIAAQRLARGGATPGQASVSEAR